MDLVNTSHDPRYWSKVLCCSIPTQLNEHEVKVTDLGNCMFLVKVVKSFLCPEASNGST